LPDTRAGNVTSNDLRETVAVVTGGASGDGDAPANAYGQRGGASVLIADRDEPALETRRVSLTDSGTETHTDLIDLCDAAAVAGLAERARSTGRITAVIWEVPDAAVESGVSVNLWATT
jgi:NADP-dependent 3-hydroxy acid dehydrogenase YdfG